jgi:phosphoribosylformylglycinamidine (FGAM) synthase PurS component
VTVDGAISVEEARQQVERMAREVLSNPVIEEYRIELDSTPEA